LIGRRYYNGSKRKYPEYVARFSTELAQLTAMLGVDA